MCSRSTATAKTKMLAAADSDVAAAAVTAATPPTSDSIRVVKRS